MDTTLTAGSQGVKGQSDSSLAKVSTLYILCTYNVYIHVYMYMYM